MNIIFRNVSLASALCLLPAAAFAQGAPMSPQQANAAQGQNVTVEGMATVSEAVGMSGTFVRLSRPGSNTSTIGFIPEGNESRFPNLEQLNGKKVDITGVVEQSSGQSLIRLSSANQLKLIQ